MEFNPIPSDTLMIYGVQSNTIRYFDDVISVDSWVEEMKSQDSSPISIYKLPGETKSGYVSLSKDDFVLGFMNDAQEEIFRIYGQDVILIDSTHGTNKYHIQLTSLTVKDDNREGFPVAFLWSNRQTEEVYKLFLIQLKKEWVS